MAFSLRDKLGASYAGNARAAAQTTPQPILIREYRARADERLFDLPDKALRRMGWTGLRFDVRKALFLDTETTGLSGGAGTIAFLVGAGYVDGADFVVTQYMMRDYADEPMLMAELARLFARFSAAVTFNGRTFDLPLLTSRFTLMRMRNEMPEFDQLDLLIPARRLWKLRLKDCRLSHLEETVLDIHRSGDVPGAEVPERFFRYLKTGDFEPLEEVIDHNRQDILTLSDLLICLADAFGNPQKQTHRVDQFSLGRALERQGDLADAREMYSLAARSRPATDIAALTEEKIVGQANFQLFELYRRAGEWEKARDTLETMISRRQQVRQAYLALAKLAEHRLHDLPRARSCTELLIEDAPEDELAALFQRKRRLEQKIANRKEEK